MSGAAAWSFSPSKPPPSPAEIEAEARRIAPEIFRRPPRRVHGAAPTPTTSLFARALSSVGAIGQRIATRLRSLTKSRRTPKMDINNIPLALRAEISALTNTISERQKVRDAAAERLDALRARVAAADQAEADFNAVVDEDPDALFALADGQANPALQRRLDHLALVRRAAEAAQRQIAPAQNVLDLADSALAEALAERREKIGAAMVVARDDLQARYADLRDRATEAAAHLAGLSQAAAETGGIMLRIDDTLMVAVPPTPRADSQWQPDDLIPTPLTRLADRQLVADAKASYVAMAARLTGEQP